VSVVQFRPWAPSALRCLVSHYLAALRLVEVSLDGFDEDNFVINIAPRGTRCSLFT
jgi:hypothetical protein